MKHSLSFWQFSGFVFTGVLGTLLHFLYDWTNSAFVALFSAVNESIWEHMKILFFPMLIFAIIESIYFRNEYENFWCVKLVGILLGLSVIPAMYYTYTGVFGVSADWFNIMIFFIAAAVAYFIETRLLRQNNCLCFSQTASIVLLSVIAILFMLFTFAPPKIPLFRDPIYKTYGINLKK